MMTIQAESAVEKLTLANTPDYAAFTESFPAATYCHALEWKAIIEQTYGHQSAFYLCRNPASGRVNGIAPSFLLKSLLFGKQVVSLPFLDYGGIIADHAGAEAALLEQLKQDARICGAVTEIRCRDPLLSCPPPENSKAAMLLSLEGFESSESYWKRLDAKVRNQVRKADKSSVSLEWGKEEKLEDFYRVFCVNMRDLGSPVHSRKLFLNVLKHLPGAQIGIARRGGACIGGLFRILWKDTLAIPWASTLKSERVHCPNNALYYESIKFAIEKGCRTVDFGRSTKNEGTYRFKKQWLAQEYPLPWYRYDKAGNPVTIRHLADSKMEKAAQVWKKFPLPAANVIGPFLRRGISA